jgi:lipopolysaccharide/colanic/teichoic acid biosynthesis glycosyltransferase
MIRICDILLSLIGLIIASPVILILIIAIKLDSKGSAFYKQQRVGKNNVDFYLFKFRSMRIGADKSGLITVGGRDSRITKVGYFIRKYKLDELPQLLNVLVGEMSLVGPRPEVRKYVDLYSKEQAKVLSVKPGISDYASIEFMDENEILGKSTNPDRDYVELIMPEKIRLNMRYINQRTIGQYLKIIFLTVYKIFR